MWNYTFDETGGYDCMTGAFHVWRDNKIIFSIDQNQYGQRHCDYKFKSKEAEDLVNWIVDSLNAGLAKQANASDLKSDV